MQALRTIKKKTHTVIATILLVSNERKESHGITHMHSDGGLELVRLESEIDGDGNQRQEQSLRDQVIDYYGENDLGTMSAKAASTTNLAYKTVRQGGV